MGAVILLLNFQKGFLVQYIFVILCFFVFTANWWYTSNGYITNRPHTLYDHFNVSRLANFEELKAAKDDYLFNLRNLHDVNYTGNKDALVNYTMKE